ncbi:hypothetical protein IWQ62_002229 [Dispira parvispora]|uniref:Uncharacterized protein n=1 Tax=Dispira parvispora TaxID=1520584 RepID=A0A9W8AX74_9FUNG|nr:hypothetical protein IWQ62_002229 [Dispira parvispora]
MLSARSELRQFNQTKLNNSMSRSLIRNAGLIIAYPAVLFLVYVPYLLTNWFTGFVGGTFTQVWVVLNGIIFSTQGILSFAIMLFHPVMLSTYSRNRSGLSSLWSEVTRRLHLSRAEAESGSSTQSYSKFSATDSTHTENPKGDAYVLSPSVKVMNSPPGFVNSSLRNNDTHINANEGKPNRFEIMVAVHSENSELDETTLGSYRSIDESTYL